MDRTTIAILLSIGVVVCLSAIAWLNWHRSHRQVYHRRLQREAKHYEQAMADKAASHSKALAADGDGVRDAG